MSGAGVVIRGNVSLLVAVLTVGLTTTTALATGSSPPGPPPLPVNGARCLHSHGKVVVAPYNNRLRVCQGGDLDGSPVIPGYEPQH